MNVLSKMMTALKGTINEVGEAIVDSQALRILDQEIREASEELKASKKKLNMLIAQQELAKEKSEQLGQSITEHEEYAKKALKKKEKALAHEIATKIAELESKQNMEVDLASSLKQEILNLGESINLSERDIFRMKQQVDTVKATESMQKAQTAIALRNGGTNAKLHTAMDSLAKMKSKHSISSSKENFSQDTAINFEHLALEKKLEAAGIKTKNNTADAVLKRLDINY